MPRKSTSPPIPLDLMQYRITKPTQHHNTQSSKRIEDVYGQHNSVISRQPQHTLPSPPREETQSAGQSKRKREEEQDDSGIPREEEPSSKQRRIDHTPAPADVRSSVVESDDPVNHWVQNNCEWSDFLKGTTTMNARPSIKRQRSNDPTSNSYSQTTRSGDKPTAWGSKYAELMPENGLFLNPQDGVTIAKEDEDLCKKILEAQHDLPKEWAFQGENFLKILNRVSFKNERRVARDIGPHIMPSPELLHMQDHSGLEHIAEALDASWDKCTSLYGPKPRPDVSHGLSRSAFTGPEREQFYLNNTCACENMVFPFYICEVKAGSRPIREAELQAFHGASVAVNTVIELYQKISKVEMLHRHILAFSVSHDERLVKIYGHFAFIDDCKTTYHRHLLLETDLVKDASDRHKPYQIALGIWEHFYPIHLARIQHALSKQEGSPMKSFTAQLEQRAGSASGASTPASLQDNSPSVLALQEEKAQLLRSMQDAEERSRQQLQDAEERSRQQLQNAEERSRQQLQEQQETSRQREEDSRNQYQRLMAQIEQLTKMVSTLQPSSS